MRIVQYLGCTTTDSNMQVEYMPVGTAHRWIHWRQATRLKAASISGANGTECLTAHYSHAGGLFEPISLRASAHPGEPAPVAPSKPSALGPFAPARASVKLTSVSGA
jgi:hypothetical protein